MANRSRISSLVEPSGFGRFSGSQKATRIACACKVANSPVGGKSALLLVAAAAPIFRIGLKMAVGREDNGTIEIWNIPPRRPWWIEYGLPILFALLLLLACRLVCRFRRPDTEIAPTVATAPL